MVRQPHQLHLTGLYQPIRILEIIKNAWMIGMICCLHNLRKTPYQVKCDPLRRFPPDFAVWIGLADWSDPFLFAAVSCASIELNVKVF